MYTELIDCLQKITNDLCGDIDKLKSTAPKAKTILVMRKKEKIASFMQELLDPFETRFVESDESISSAVKDIRRYKKTRVIIALEEINDSDVVQIEEALKVLSIKVIVKSVIIFAFEDSRSSKDGFDVITPG